MIINVVDIPVALGILFVFYPNNIKSNFCCISYLEIKNNNNIHQVCLYFLHFYFRTFFPEDLEAPEEPQSKS